MEELKIVMEAIAQLGQAGKEAFIWWLVLTYGTKILTALMILVGVLGVPYIVVRGVASHGKRGAAIKSIGELVGVKFYPWQDYPSPGERIEDVVDAVRARAKP